MNFNIPKLVRCCGFMHVNKCSLCSKVDVPTGKRSATEAGLSDEEPVKKPKIIIDLCKSDDGKLSITFIL